MLRLLQRVPLDPFDGKPLKYRRLQDGVVIYSVGPDEIDNGGNLWHGGPWFTGKDIGYRLWDVAKRRLPPKPDQHRLPPDPRDEPP